MSITTLFSAIGSIGSMVTGLLSAALSTGPYGIAALCILIIVGGVGGVLAWNKIVGYFNSSTDARDQANAGADAGETSVDLSNQAAAVRQGLDGMQAQNPPTDPSAAQAEKKEVVAP